MTMALLDPRKVVYLVVHTAAHLGDPGIEEIRRWHVEERGWEDCGYHWVIRKNGDLETGRSLEYQGAHCLGINHASIGVCCSGHGDAQPFTAAQEATLIRLAVHIHREYGVEPRNLIGHREVNSLVAANIIPAKYLTDKTCPGRRVAMGRLRRMFVDAIVPPPDPITLRAA